MSKYDKEFDTRTEEYEEAIEPLERETKQKEEKGERRGETEKQKDANP